MESSKTSVYGCGYLNRIRLTLNDEKDVIRGFISIRTSQDNIVTFNVFQNKLTSNGKNNPAFKSMLTVLEQYKDVTMVDSYELADIVEIKENGIIFPNAKIYPMVKNNSNGVSNTIIKSVNFITRNVKSNKMRIVFKIYGVMVDNIIGDKLYCSIIDHNQIAHEIILKNTCSGINKNDILNVAGLIREGMDETLPVCDYIIKKFETNNEYSISDFETAKVNYTKYVDGLQEDSPF